MGKKQGARHGFLLTAVGSAVGLGNIWGFPYKMGMNGGFAFLLVYLVLAAVVGITVVTAELAIGRSTGRRPVNAYKRLSPGASWLGYLTLTASFIVLGFYSVLGGIVTRHAVSYLTSVFGYNTWGAYTAAGFLNRFLVNGEGMALWTAIFILISTAVLTVGARENVEKFCRVGMPALLTVFIALTVYTALQPGAYDGFRFMFSWNIEPLRENFLGVLSSAAGQLLLSLSLGLGILITYGSFLEKKEKLQRSSAVIVICDTAVAVLSGVLVIPACFAFMDGDISFDPCLLFNSVQEIFLRMDYFGTVMGFVFYALVLSAALSSTVSVMDVIASAMADMDIAKNRAPRRR
ncbi:MAG: sodium-dependent transporter, partial [Oscillospiraceae bacterium]|nr:sodium-dependent transporter [Oscillospiraceae bacterium]